MRLRVRILVRILVVRRFAIHSSQIINIPIKGFTAQKVVVLNDDEPRPLSISKDFVHLMIRKINEACFNIFMTQVSAFAYLIVIYNSLFIFHFKCCGILHFAICELLCSHSKLSCYISQSISVRFECSFCKVESHWYKLKNLMIVASYA